MQHRCTWATSRAHFDIMTLAAFCKNHGFREECEWRIMLLVDSMPGRTAPLHRLSNDAIVPYYELRFSREAITEIWVGPRNPMRTQEGAMRSFLAANGFVADDVRIEKSEVTYRGTNKGWEPLV